MDELEKIISGLNLPEPDREILEKFGWLAGNENLEMVNKWLLENPRNAFWLADNLRQKTRALESNDLKALAEIFEGEFEFLEK